MNSSFVVKSLNNLHVESFRGFYNEVIFDLKNQYSLFFGANGSGKSSFCEALEYCLLGTIEESNSKNINIHKYIKNIYTNKSKQPILLCKDNNNCDFPATPDINRYRFCFIEKNRIDRFSHISAISVKNQTELLSALFGFSEFNKFVDDFASSLDKYVLLSSTKKEEYDKFILSNQHLQEELNSEKSKSKQYDVSINQEIKKLKEPKITNYDQAIAYINGNDTNGELQNIINEINTLRDKRVNNSWYKTLTSDISQLSSKTLELNNITEQLNQNTASIAFLDFYESLNKLKEVYTDKICPACKTPLNNVIINPFENALNQIKILNEIKQNGIRKKELIKNMKPLIDSINQNITSVKEFNSIFGYDSSNYIISIELEMLENSSIEFASLLRQVEKLMSKFSNQSEILDCIEKYNKKNETEINKLQEKKKIISDIYKVISDNHALWEQSKKTIRNQEESIFTYKEKKITLENELATEQKVIDYNQKMNFSYQKVITLLQQYKKELPIIMSEQIGKKVAEFYNIINSDDAAFEQVDSINMPINEKESIEIVFKDSSKCDALQVLSEGHIKILGLSILLAKAALEDVPFLIFNDIVNSIDDDHRSGVITLLTTASELINKQIIITCHGDRFIKNMQFSLKQQGKEKQSTTYYFMSAINLKDRGIVINFDQPKEPLTLAETKLKEGSLKDSAAKCRQATECIAYFLWKKLTKDYINCPLNVQLRTPTSKPDLQSIINSLANYLKGIENCEDLRNNLIELCDKYYWDILNTGTH